MLSQNKANNVQQNFHQQLPSSPYGAYSQVSNVTEHPAMEKVNI